MLRTFLRMTYHYENVQENFHYLVGKAASAAAAGHLDEITHVLAENLRYIFYATTAYRFQINKGQYNNIFFIFS